MNKPIRVAIVGVGNCASALVQGVDLYTAEDLTDGLMFPEIGGYTASDIEFVAAFDVDARKVGLRLREAIYEGTNKCFPIYDMLTDEVADWNPIVLAAPLLDGVADHMVTTDPADTEKFFIKNSCCYTAPGTKYNEIDGTILDEYVYELARMEVDVLLNYLPVGSEEATRFWAEVCLRARVNMVNCIPSFIASDKEWARKFAQEGVTIIGDDMRSQIGASIISAALHELFLKRGANIEVHYQDNVGGNTDF